MNSSKTLFGEVSPGDWVLSASNNDYSYLIGMVTAIEKHGTPEHDTDNQTDDIHINFSAFDYPSERISEIEERFSALYGEKKTFDEISLDNVIMAPDMLIRISHLGIDEITRMGNLRANCEAYNDCFLSGIEPQNDKHAELLKRIDKNLGDYHNSLMDFGNQELINMAGKIAAMSDVHSYLSYRGFEDDKLDFLLQLQNPLEVVAEGWRDYNIDNDNEMGFSFDNVMRHKQDWLDSNPLVGDIGASDEPGSQRFMDVNLIDFLGRISEKVIIHYPKDFQIDCKELHRVANLDNPDDRRLMWHVSSWGTHLNTERDTYIKGTGAYNTWVDYRPNDPDMFGYIIEVTGKNGGIVTGNVFEIEDYAEHVSYVKEMAFLLDSVSLTYTDDWGVNAGNTITVPRYEYDKDRHRLMSESGNVKSIEYHPSELITEMSSVLIYERSQRMIYPVGSQEAHLENLSKKLTEIRKPPELDENPIKKSFAEQLKDADAKAKAHNAQISDKSSSKAKNRNESIE